MPNNENQNNEPIEQEVDELPIGSSKQGSQSSEPPPVSTKGEAMAEGQGIPADLAPGVASEMVREGVAAHQTIMTESKGNIQHSNNLMRVISSKKFDEVGSIEAQAVNKVLNKLQ